MAINIIHRITLAILLSINSLAFAQINIDTYFGSNATAALSIPAYQQYNGVDEVVHPDVLHFPDGWHGYKYWMAFTPYPNSVATYENPSIVVSNDNLSWVIPTGGANPINSFSSSSPSDYNSDPDLVMSPDNSTMYLFWRRYRGSQHQESIEYRASSDGIHWSAATQVVSVDSYEQWILSPAIVYNGSQFLMWTVEKVIGGQARKVYLRTASQPAGPWSARVLTNIGSFGTDASNRILSSWHINVIFENGMYWMINNVGSLEASGQSEWGDYLYLGYSADGINWTFGTHPVLNPITSSIYGSLWQKRLYRASIVPLNDGSGGLGLYYSVMGVPYSIYPWKIAYTKIYNQAQNVVISRNGNGTRISWSAFQTSPAFTNIRYKVQANDNPDTPTWVDVNPLWLSAAQYDVSQTFIRKFYRVVVRILP